MPRIFYLSAVASGILAAALGVARANPQGGSVASGNASIVQSSPSQLTVNQGSSRVIINWQGFSIAPGEITSFVQPSASAVALNRVTGGDPSIILGQLSANGRILLINPNGVLFGAGSRVDVAGLIATTANLSDQDFQAGRLNFAMPSSAPTASVVNRGTITVAEGGLVALVAPGVANEGVIQARLGRVSLVSADRFTVDFHGDQLIQFALGDTVTRTVVAPDGMPLAAAVTNSGRIVDSGGMVQMSANVASGVLDQAIDMSGVVEARSVHQVNGAIVLDGGSAGAVAVSGKLDVSGRGAGQTGGTVQILGQHVGLFGGTDVNASGSAGGGTVLVGGNQHGQGPLPNAQATYVDPQATIDADATVKGNGGTVVVWSDQYTNFGGTITARGGAQGGNGGSVETSSHDVLSVTGQVDASARNGKPGLWLLDPYNVTIVASTMNESPGPVFTPGGSPAQIDPASIDAALNAGTSVTVTTTSPTGMEAGTLTVQSAISKTVTVVGATPTLTLSATTDYLQNASITSTSGALNVSVTAGGGYTSNQSISTSGGTLSVTAGGNYTGNSISSGGGSVTIGAGGSYTGLSGIDTGGGALSITAGASVNLGGIGTGAGNITVMANGIIMQGGGPISQLNGTASFTAGANPIQLTNGGNALGIVTLSNSGANNVAVTNNSDLLIGSASVGTGTLTLQSLSGSVAQPAVGTITQAAGAGLATITANTAIDLGNVNNFTGPVSLNNSSGANVLLNNSGPLVLAASNVSNGTLHLVAGGGVTQTGALVQLGGFPGSVIVQAGAGPITLTNAGNRLGGDLFLTNTGNNPVSITSTTPLSVNNSTIGGALTLTADIIQTPGTVTSGGGTLTVQPLTPTTNVQFGGNGLFVGLAFSDTQIAKYSGFTGFTAGSATGTGMVSLGASEALANNVSLTLQAGGAGGSVMMGGNSVTLMGTGALTLSAGNAVTTAAITLASGALSVTAGTDTIVTAPIATAGGAITLNGPITLAGATTLNTSLGGASGAINLAGPVTGGTTLTLNAGGAGDITLQSVGSVGAPLAGITIQDARNVTASGLVATNTLTQLAGTGTTNFAGPGLASAGAVTLTTGAVAGTYNVAAFTVTSGQTIANGSIAGSTGASAATLATDPGSTGTQTFNGCVIGLAGCTPPPSSPASSPGGGVTPGQAVTVTTSTQEIIGALAQPAPSDNSDQSNVHGFEVTIPMQNIDWSDPAGDLSVKLAPDYESLGHFFYAGECSSRLLLNGNRCSR